MFQIEKCNTKNKKRNKNTDRFIVRRKESDFFETFHNNKDTNRFNVDSILMSNGGYFLNYSKIYFNHKNYVQQLHDTLFSNSSVNNYEEKIEQQYLKCSTRIFWPVKPRRKPCIGPPQVILDMPCLYNNRFKHLLVDWNSQNYLSAISNNKVNIWSPEGYNPRETLIIDQRLTYLKWSPSSNKLAMAFGSRRFGIYDHFNKKSVGESTCCGSRACIITALEWIDDNTLLTGCSVGTLKIYNQILELQNFGFIDECIVAIKVSCDKTLIAIILEKGGLIVVRFTERMCFTVYRMENPEIKYVSWHPWRNPLLAVCGLDGNRKHIHLVNVLAQTKNLIFESSSSITALSFNPRSAELTICSFEHKDNSSTDVPCIEVLGKRFSSSEHLHMHEGYVSHLLWNNNGTQLASIGTDETMCIWNFFGNDKRKKNAIPKKKLIVSDIFRCHIR